MVTNPYHYLLSGLFNEFCFEASIPKGIPSGCENLCTCTLVSLNLGKGAGL